MGAAPGRGCRGRSGVHPCTHSLPRPSMAAATTPPTRRVFGMLCGRRFDRGSVLALTRRQGYRCRPGVPVGAGGTGHASVERRRDPTQPARRAPAGIRRPFRQQAGSYESRSPPVRSPQTKRWPALQSKLRPVSRPRTSWPGGMAPVAHGCATTRVRTGRPPEGCAPPPGHGGPFRSRRPATRLKYPGSRWFQDSTPLARLRRKPVHWEWKQARSQATQPNSPKTATLRRQSPA